MHSITSYSHYLPKRLIGVCFGLLAAILITSVVAATFGPQRPTKAYQDDATSFDYITFNSITGTPYYGNEQDFLKSRVLDRNDTMSDKVTDVEDGDIISVSTYFHNNANPDMNEDGSGVAENVMLDIDMPSGFAAEQQIDAYITSTPDAVPSRIWDTTTITSKRDFSLEYVPGSAQIRTDHFTAELSDSLINDGVLLGDDQLDGKVMAGFDNDGWVVFRVKVVQPEEEIPNFTVVKQARITEDATWSSTITAKPGDTIEYRITINNTGNTVLQSIDISDQMPANVFYVDNSTTLNGEAVSDVVNNGIAISSLNIEHTNLINYRAIVGSAEMFDCGINHASNTVSVLPAGFTEAKTSTTTVEFTRVCEAQDPIFDCRLAVSIDDITDRKVNATIKNSMSNDVGVERAKIDFGDGTIINTGSAGHSYNQAGMYTITGTVTFNVNDQLKEVTCSDTVQFVDEVVFITVCRDGKEVEINQDNRLTTDTDTCPPPTTPDDEAITVCRVGEVIKIKRSQLRNSDIIGNTCPDTDSTDEQQSSTADNDDGQVLGATPNTLPNTGISVTSIMLNTVGISAVLATTYSYLSSRRLL